ncbi:MAG TPA: hypothetical protein VFM45_03355, partial [Anaeromyxobacteraceae bacterium]|nr:hypothetical protein [Anaeromyxobacteraceae bacterium]
MATALGLQAAAAGGPGAEAARAGMDRAIGTKDRAWSEFLLEAAEAVGAVVEMHGGEPTGKLRVTRAERAAIRARLEKEFGNEVRGPPGEEQEPLLLVATGWYRILGDPLYRAAAEGATDPAERAPAGSAR